ncbi:hypothetical protein LPUS_11751 [Lasallia pustulata]|uniref:DUF7598 domain-containing protein n=1 Tax=Lasallia pustulata TaxID=136370 RepID=A0A1W5DD11_9LECA|nr:hypothetical protein LPUS_11751 [Lasallia pustulata]
MSCFKRSLAGPGYIILNTIRVTNIIALLAVIAASSVMLVKTFIISKFFFFDGVSHLITAGTSLFLIISELPFFRGYYARNWPLLSISSGFVTLGFLMIVVGVGILGNLNKAATSEQSLGLAFWRIVISSGIVVLVLGVVNIFANYIFRDTSQGVTARMVRAHGAVAPQKVDVYRSGTSSTRRKSFHLGRSDTLPSYHPPETRQQQQPPARIPMTISAPVSSNPDQFAKFKGSAEVGRPDLAHHPALSGGRF